MRKTGRIHYCWIIVAAGFLINAACLGTIGNCFGVFFPHVCADTGWQLSKLTAFMIFYGIAGTVMMNFVDRVFDRLPFRPVLAVSLALSALACVLFGLMRTLPGFYLAGTLLGITTSFVMYVPVPMMINNWFAAKKGIALGIAAAAAGVSAAVMNPLINSVILASGSWRTGYFVQGAVVFGIGVPAAVFLARKTPEECGLKPYGEEISAALATARQHPAAAEAGETPAAAAPSGVPDGKSLPAGRSGYRLWKVLAVVLLSVLYNLIGSYMQHLTNYGVAEGLSSTAGAAFTSATMTGNFAGKLCCGSACDRFGARRTATVIFLLITSGMIMLAVGKPLGVLLYPAAFLIGLNHSGIGILTPLEINSFADREQFKSVMAKSTMGLMVSAAV